MRVAIASPLLIAGATMIAAADAQPAALPLASNFDLGSTALHRPAYLRTVSERGGLTGRFGLSELSEPPMPPHKPAKLRIRGKKVKLRLPLG